MNKQLKKLIINIVVIIAKSINYIIPKRGIVLCFPPAPENSRGDMALILGALNCLKRRKNKINIILTSNQKINFLEEKNNLKIYSKFHQVFNTQRSFIEQIKLIIFLIGKKHFILIGCDVLDGKYSLDRSISSLSFIKIASNLGLKTRIICFSFNNENNIKLKKIIKSYNGKVKLITRDKKSFNRLKKLKIKDLNLAGDLAFLVKPANFNFLNKKTRIFIEKNKQNLIGLNFIEPVFGKKNTDFFDKIAKICIDLSEKGYRFILIPHHEPMDVEYMKYLHNKIKDISYFLDPIPSANEIKTIAKECKHVFSSRLHLAIASLGVGTPVTCFPYQNKFEGQLNYFNLKNSLYHYQDLPQTIKGLNNLFEKRIKASNKESIIIKKKLPKIINLAKKNFEKL
jgi:polysaccharide pyruvyl transferase WcaK-like protein